MVSLLIVFGIALLAISGYAAEKSPAPAKLAALCSPKSGLTPNELGRIMILEYHLIGYPEADWRRTPENFRKDLQMLYDNDYYPITLQDLVTRNIRVPAGKTPFVLTFDDSSKGQFNYLVKSGALVIDPQCAVGIMEQFKKEHPDFPLTATFYVLPAIDPGLRLFGQEEYIKQKLEFLVKHGYEIGNHSYWHQNLAKTDDAGVQKQLALCLRAVQSYLPGYEMRSLSLPFGVFAKNPQLETAGVHEGTKYRHDSVVLVGSGSVPSPFSKDFNPLRLERIQAGDTPWGPKAFVDRYQKNPSLRYVSDGNANTISVPKGTETNIPATLAAKYRVLSVEPVSAGQ
jgi:peptidoglycan/xylan/chitin deacetylase (PgdA/CDA1 family)